MSQFSVLINFLLVHMYAPPQIAFILLSDCFLTLLKMLDAMLLKMDLWSVPQPSDRQRVAPLSTLKGRQCRLPTHWLREPF